MHRNAFFLQINALHLEELGITANQHAPNAPNPDLFGWKTNITEKMANCGVVIPVDCSIGTSQQRLKFLNRNRTSLRSNGSQRCKKGSSFSPTPCANDPPRFNQLVQLCLAVCILN